MGSSKNRRTAEMAKEMRGNPTPAEAKFKILMKERKIDGCRDQVVVGGYILDFYFKKSRLVVEIDGSAHKYRQQRDEQRTFNLADHGCRVIRFTNERVFLDPDGVVSDVLEALKLHRCLYARLPIDAPQRGRGILTTSSGNPRNIKSGRVKLLEPLRLCWRNRRFTFHRDGRRYEEGNFANTAKR